MTILKTSGLALLAGSMLILAMPQSSKTRIPTSSRDITLCITPRGCVFRTIFGEEVSIPSRYPTPGKVQYAIDKGLGWMIQAQQANGGWGAGSHQRQDVLDPHAVQTDPATTAMVAMALLRTGSTLTSGQYRDELKKALFYLIDEVESTPSDRLKITPLSGTQIQTKLGNHIDAVLTAQFFSNLLDHLDHDQTLKDRVKTSLDQCVDKIERAQNDNGSFKGAGWAGVLQSSMATTALEAAEHKGIEVERAVLDKAREYQKSNYNPSTGDVKMEEAAGIVLYSVSGSVRSSAKEARKVREKMADAKKEGQLGEDAEVSIENLVLLGYSRDEAMRYTTSYQVYESSKNKAQEDAVMDGFGNNGGEEFLSYLQTGESLVVNNDGSWKQWYQNISNRLMSIQEENGSWRGHHCITSPVFCTATTLLTLSVNNDIERLTSLGQE